MFFEVCAEHKLMNNKHTISCFLLFLAYSLYFLRDSLICTMLVELIILLFASPDFFLPFVFYSNHTHSSALFHTPLLSNRLQKKNKFLHHHHTKSSPHPTGRPPCLEFPPAPFATQYHPSGNKSIFLATREIETIGRGGQVDPANGNHRQLGAPIGHGQHQSVPVECQLGEPARSGTRRCGSLTFGRWTVEVSMRDRLSEETIETFNKLGDASAHVK